MSRAPKPEAETFKRLLAQGLGLRVPGLAGLRVKGSFSDHGWGQSWAASRTPCPSTCSSAALLRECANPARRKSDQAGAQVLLRTPSSMLTSRQTCRPGERASWSGYPREALARRLRPAATSSPPRSAPPAKTNESQSFRTSHPASVMCYQLVLFITAKD